MGRIADAVLCLLADGPAAAEDLGAALARGGITRSRDPASAVRRATRDDPRIIRIADGRLASVAGALTGLDLTTVVSAEAAAAGAVDVEPDLAPLALLGLGPAVALPSGAAAGDAVAVRLEDAGERRVSVRRIARLARRPGDEAAVLAAVAERLSRWMPGRPWAAPPAAHLATVAASVAAVDPAALRAAGRPLSQVLAEAGYEVHLGWVGPRGTGWGGLAEEQAAALEADAAGLLADGRTAEAALVQERLLAVLRRHLPGRAAPARRRLARTLARAGRAPAALATLAEAFPEGDPEDWYEAAAVAVRSGDEVSARRWVEAGLARCSAPQAAEAAECLADIGGDLDAQAAFLRLRAGLGEIAPDEDGADRVARAIVGPRRSYLVEAMVEEVLGAIAPNDLPAFLEALGDAGDAGRDARIAVVAVLPPHSPAAAGARRPRARRVAVRGLVEACPRAAWTTSRADAPDQQQLVVAVGKEGGRVSPLVALIDHAELGGGVKDAFFLPDMASPRLRREILAPMEELGLPGAAADVGATIAALRAGLEASARAGWTLPSLRTQPVLDRIERWVMRPR